MCTKEYALPLLLKILGVVLRCSLFLSCFCKKNFSLLNLLIFNDLFFRFFKKFLLSFIKIQKTKEEFRMLTSGDFNVTENFLLSMRNIDSILKIIIEKYF